MSDRKDLTSQLATLGLGQDEARLYIALLQGPTTHLKLSRNIGIARTKVYRLVDQLEKRGLVQRQIDDKGSSLVASSPHNLEIELTQIEERAQRQRTVLESVIPQLNALRMVQDDGFQFRTYEGSRGFRQMCWHELNAKTEVLALGGGTIEELIENHGWAEKHRALTVKADYRVRELMNIRVDPPAFTSNVVYVQERYACRSLPFEVITFVGQTIIYNNTVAIYHQQHTQKVGIEIINKGYADMMRTMFEHYWSQAVK